MGTFFITSDQGDNTTAQKDPVIVQGKPLHTEFQLTASSLNRPCIIWINALGHFSVVG